MSKVSWLLVAGAAISLYFHITYPLVIGGLLQIALESSVNTFFQSGMLFNSVLQHSFLGHVVASIMTTTAWKKLLTIPNFWERYFEGMMSHPRLVKNSIINLPFMSKHWQNNVLFGIIYFYKSSPQKLINNSIFLAFLKKAPEDTLAHLGKLSEQDCTQALITLKNSGELNVLLEKPAKSPSALALCTSLLGKYPSLLNQDLFQKFIHNDVITSILIANTHRLHQYMAQLLTTPSFQEKLLIDLSKQEDNVKKTLLLILCNAKNDKLVRQFIDLQPEKLQTMILETLGSSKLLSFDYAYAILNKALQTQSSKFKNSISYLLHSSPSKIERILEQLIQNAKDISPFSIHLNQSPQIAWAVVKQAHTDTNMQEALELFFENKDLKEAMIKAVDKSPQLILQHANLEAYFKQNHPRLHRHLLQQTELEKKRRKNEESEEKAIILEHSNGQSTHKERNHTFASKAAIALKKCYPNPPPESQEILKELQAHIENFKDKHTRDIEYLQHVASHHQQSNPELVKNIRDFFKAEKTSTHELEKLLTQASQHLSKAQHLIRYTPTAITKAIKDTALRFVKNTRHLQYRDTCSRTRVHDMLYFYCQMNREARNNPQELDRFLEAQISGMYQGHREYNIQAWEDLQKEIQQRHLDLSKSHILQELCAKHFPSHNPSDITSKNAQEIFIACRDNHNFTADVPSCASGLFNKLCEVLQDVHPKIPYKPIITRGTIREMFLNISQKTPEALATDLPLKASIPLLLNATQFQKALKNKIFDTLEEELGEAECKKHQAYIENDLLANIEFVFTEQSPRTLFIRALTTLRIEPKLFETNTPQQADELLSNLGIDQDLKNILEIEPASANQKDLIKYIQSTTLEKNNYYPQNSG